MNPTTRRVLALVACVGAALLAPTNAQAVVLPPGGITPLAGAPGPAGLVVRDEAIPFQVVDPVFLTVLYEGVLQDRVILKGDGTLAFIHRIASSTVGFNGSIAYMTTSGFEGVTTDVDWSSTGIGTIAPDSAWRSGDGDSVTFDYDPLWIRSGSNSKFEFISTDAEHWSVSGKLTILLREGYSVTLDVAAPVLDETPPIVDILDPTNLECVCGTFPVFGIAYDPETALTDTLLEYKPAIGGSWAPIASGFPETPAAGATIANWNTAALTQGYYLLRMSATNEADLFAEDVEVCWVDTQFDQFSWGGPSDGNVYGGTVCFTGTINDHCSVEYIVEQRPSGVGSFTPVDPGNPVYFGGKINQTFATWNSTTVPDGDYDVYVSASDGCHDVDEERTITIDNTAPTASISSPVNCDSVDGLVSVIGTAFDDNISGWALQYTGGPANTWVTIATGNTNVVDDVLGVWNTNDLPPCCYTLRLVASDKAWVNCDNVNHQTIFLTSVEVGGCSADLATPYGILDFSDVLAFLTAFGAGCP
ncbi:MAG: hypothetical protein R3B57_07055 [Phycisphaerales bacterium]